MLTFFAAHPYLGWGIALVLAVLGGALGTIRGLRSFSSSATAKFLSFLLDDGKGILLLFVLMLLVSLGLLYGSAAVEAEQPLLARALYVSAGMLAGTGSATLLVRTMWWKEAVRSVFKDLVSEFQGPLRAMLSLGLNDVVWFGGAVPWKDWLQDTKSFEVFAIRAATFFGGDSMGSVKEFLRRPDTKLTVVFADPDDEELMKHYDTAFGEDSGTRRRKVLESIKHAQELAESVDATNRLSIRVARKPYHFAMYRFDGERILFTPLWSKPGKDPARIPGFLFGGGEMLANALGEEAEFLLSEEGSSKYTAEQK